MKLNLRRFQFGIAGLLSLMAIASIVLFIIQDCKVYKSIEYLDAIWHKGACLDIKAMEFGPEACRENGYVVMSSHYTVAEESEKGVLEIRRGNQPKVPGPGGSYVVVWIGIDVPNSATPDRLVPLEKPNPGFPLKTLEFSAMKFTGHIDNVFVPSKSSGDITVLSRTSDKITAMVQVKCCFCLAHPSELEYFEFSDTLTFKAVVRN